LFILSLNALRQQRTELHAVFKDYDRMCQIYGPNNPSRTSSTPDTKLNFHVMALRGLRGVPHKTATVVLRVQESTEIIPKFVDNQNDYEAYF
jgi:endonuclease III